MSKMTHHDLRIGDKVSVNGKPPRTISRLLGGDRFTVHGIAGSGEPAFQVWSFYENNVLRTEQTSDTGVRYVDAFLLALDESNGILDSEFADKWLDELLDEGSELVEDVRQTFLSHSPIFRFPESTQLIISRLGEVAFNEPETTDE